MYEPPFSHTTVKAFIPDARTIPLRDLNKRRQDFFQAFDAWLKTSADPTGALLELESTICAARGLVALAFCDLADHPLVSGTPAVKRGIP